MIWFGKMKGETFKKNFKKKNFQKNFKKIFKKKIFKKKNFQKKFQKNSYINFPFMNYYTPVKFSTLIYTFNR